MGKTRIKPLLTMFSFCGHLFVSAQKEKRPPNENSAHLSKVSVWTDENKRAIAKIGAFQTQEQTKEWETEDRRREKMHGLNWIKQTTKVINWCFSFIIFYIFFISSLLLYFSQAQEVFNDFSFGFHLYTHKQTERTNSEIHMRNTK